MESLNMNANIRVRKRFGGRSVLTEFVLLAVILVSVVIALSQWTTHEAEERYGILESSYWDVLPYKWVPVTENGKPTEVGASDWSGDRQRVYQNGVGPRYASFSFEHKVKGGLYLIAQYASPYVYTIVILGGGLFLFYRRRIRRPLQALIRSAERVASGDLDFRVALLRRDEFGRIGEAFERMRSELENGNRQMWQLAEQRRQLNAAFSHDLRTPLAVLKGRIDLLADFYPSGDLDREETISAIEALRRNAERLERYVTSMNAVQKLDDLEADLRAIELTELAEELREIAEALRGPRTLDFGSMLPAAASLDRNLIARVFENLMVNAQRFATGRIVVRFDPSSDSLRIVVSDDGPGFTPEALSQAVEPYYRGSDAEADVHFGLGLYICRLLCEKHGGTLRLGSEPSGGAEVTAEFRTLPIGADSEA